eukprot:2242839-Rhodomonas_salina.1
MAVLQRRWRKSQSIHSNLWLLVTVLCVSSRIPLSLCQGTEEGRGSGPKELLPWAKEHGAVIHNAELQKDDGEEGFSLVATADIEQGRIRREVLRMRHAMPGADKGCNIIRPGHHVHPSRAPLSHSRVSVLACRQHDRERHDREDLCHVPVPRRREG